MERFADKHRDSIVGALDCFDRILLKGHLPFGSGRAMEALLERHGVAYQRIENAFASVAYIPRAERFADAMASKNWLPVPEALARRVNPFLRDLLADVKHYRVIEQAEYSTGILLKDRAALKELCPGAARRPVLQRRRRHALPGAQAPRRLPGSLQTDFRRRPFGVRVRHAIAGNILKMYDKHGLVPRVELVINRPGEFKEFREGARHGERTMGWFPMAKRIANLKRYAEISRQANRRCLAALSVVDDPSVAYGELHRLCRPVTYKKRRRRGLTPLRPDGAQLLAPALRGERAIRGFLNRSLRRHLYRSKPRNRSEARRRAQHVTRRIELLRAHGPVAKIPHSQRYRVTQRGAQPMGAALQSRSTCSGRPPSGGPRADDHRAPSRPSRTASG